ncbi:hypothetical protein BDN70DRAFT_886276 [Pholiota conissans]|uniref:Uncharacterized protein n=1 Tax=Pholiota conissans TaxID=109636 RepID=A0A9P5YNG5_9AGAR|nr:hypothetical protein BDN70DRAFT_886276 [Pholiota conissans]
MDPRPAQSRFSRHSSRKSMPPPPLARRATIDLPSLSVNPILIHKFLSRQRSSTGFDAPIHWNMALPPSTARLAAALAPADANANGTRWSRVVAVSPQSAPSVTVRIEGIERPVVVFPATIGYPIRIEDMLETIHSVLRYEAFEALGVHGLLPGDVDSSSGMGNVAFDEAATANAIQRKFPRGAWWGGLYESADEREVWVLEVCAAKRAHQRS